MSHAASEDPRSRGFRTRTEVGVVEALLAERIGSLGSERVPLLEAAGRQLAERVDAEIDVPSFDRAAMDGYAVIAEDTFGVSEYSPAEVRVIGRSLPGRPFVGEVRRGQCVGIATGAPLPAGADAVLEIERTRARDDTIQIVGAVTPGKH
ncbi:MAG: molybdopterin molybdenumtransferase MoeA, partial [Planctomycetes bacterium]|nr:molybdopterin molybdenumtransferase MoeA [Planctomycetota bacterium]